jgi:hypothetical protein
MTASLSEKEIEASLYGIGMIDAMIDRIELEVQELRLHRDHLFMLGKFNGVPVARMAEACGISVQAVYRAIDHVTRSEEEQL